MELPVQSFHTAPPAIRHLTKWKILIPANRSKKWTNIWIKLFTNLECHFYWALLEFILISIFVNNDLLFIYLLPFGVLQLYQHHKTVQEPLRQRTETKFCVTLCKDMKTSTSPPKIFQQLLPQPNHLQRQRLFLTIRPNSIQNHWFD